VSSCPDLYYFFLCVSKKMVKMKILLKLVSIVGLILTLLPSIGVFYEVISQEENKYFMLIGTLLWFGPKIIFKAK
ncbi:MAG: hypothetical protein NWR22_06360, partial [Saprospiraceae bacterium]|nr:hypothetical protein [Saprospiraceae bacterium]